LQEIKEADAHDDDLIMYFDNRAGCRSTGNHHS